MRSHLPMLDSAMTRLMADPPFQPFGREDAKALALARWFKTSYMTWVDPIKCPACSGPTTAVGSVDPDRKERADGAGRTELHVCKAQCGGSRRFARYNSISTLMRTREGRCGES
jgi:peptide-N4-(N-acetyl-beta-glucosaminyl)asparagine amidase